MRKSKKIIALVLSISLIAGMANSLIGSGTTKAAESSNGSSDLSEYLNVYEDFEGYDNENFPYTLNWLESSYGSAATTSVETGNGNKWLKITGNNAAGHQYTDSGWAREDFSGKVSDHDGIAVYVYAEEAATFNFMFGLEGGRTRTYMNDSLQYTLVTKDGKKTTGTGANGVPLEKGFEGWVILGYDALTPAGGWTETITLLKTAKDKDGNEKPKFQDHDLKWINVMACEITNSQGSVYVDNIAFVKNCDNFISHIAPPTVYDFLNVYEGFNGYELGNTYELNIMTGYGDTKANVTVMEKDITGNRWLKFGTAQGSGDNFYGHRYSEANTARTDFVGKIDDYNGMATYVRADSDATFNLLMYSGGGRGRTRTATNAQLDYTLITKDGKKTTGTGAYGIPLKKGFEGWIILGYDELTVASGYDKPNAGGTAIEFIQGTDGWGNSLAFIELLAVEITNSTAPVYVDDISFVTDTAEMIEFLAPTVVTAEDYLMVYEDFEGFDANSNYRMDYTSADGGELVATATVVEKDTDSKWLQLSGKNRAGHTYTTPKAGVDGAPADYNGVAVYVKSEKASTFNVLLRSSGLTRTVNNGELSYALVSKDGTLTQSQHTNGVPLPAGFEGWVVFSKGALTNALNWTTGAFDKITNLNQIDVFTVEVTDTDGVFYVDNLSFVSDTAKFIELLHVPTPVEYVKYYETFDGYKEGTDSYLLNDLGNEFFENKTNAIATVEEVGENNHCLKVNGNNNVGHLYGVDNSGAPAYGWARNDFSADSSEYQGISLEVKTEFSAKLNLRFRQGLNRIKKTAVNRTAVNDSVEYTLISKSGEVTKKVEAYGITIPAGFEGTVVLNKAMAKQHSNYSDLWAYYTDATTDDEKDLKWLNEFSVEITETEGAVYLDNYAFVTDVDAYVESFKNVSRTYETGDINEDHSVDNYDAKLERVELVKADNKMLQLDGSNAYPIEVQSKIAEGTSLNYDGFATYIKTDAKVTYNMRILHHYGQGGVGYLGTETTENGESDTSNSIAYTLVSKHGTKIEKTETGQMTIPANFEGWLVFGKEEVSRSAGWHANEQPILDKVDLTKIFGFNPIINSEKSDIHFQIGAFAVITNKKAFVDTLATEMNYLHIIEDFENFEYGDIELIDNYAPGTAKANATIVHSGDYAQESYNVNGDRKVNIKDLVRIKKIAGGTYAASTVNTTEIVNDLSVWNTPGLAQNKDFQFDVEATSTWASVTEDETAYYNALNSYKVGETTSLLPSKGAREWGYSLVWLDGQTDGAGNKIESTFKDKPESDTEALAKMKEFIQNQYKIDLETDSWVSMNSYYPWYHYAAEFGADVVSTEIGEKQNNYQMHTAFVRGAGRQYGIPWGIDFSMWHDGYMYNPNGYNPWNKKSETNGHSLSLLERSLVMGYMGGANSVVAEAGGAMSLKNDNGTLSLTEYGKTLKKVYQFTENVDGGTAYTPIGIVLDYYHGSYAGITTTKLINSYNKEDQKSFATFDYDAGDTMTKQLMETIWGNDAWVSGSQCADADEVGSLVNNNDYGDSFDILLQNASLKVLKSYPALVLSGTIQLSDEEVQTYKQYVNDGGVLILNTAYTTQFKVFNETMPYGDGQVIVYGSKDYDLTGIGDILKEQIEKYQPVKVTCDIQYNTNNIQCMTSVKDDTVYVTLINNDGVTKEGDKKVSVDKTKSSAVTVQYTGSHNVASVADVYNQYSVNATGQSASVTVPAGGIAVLEFKLK